MKRFLCILVLICFASLTKAQTLPIFTDYHLLPSKEQPFRNYTEYKIDNMLFYNGEGKESKYFYILSQRNGSRIFEFDTKDSKARRFVPRFYRSEGIEDITIICVSVEHDYSWGSHIFIVENGVVYHSGYLGYGADNFNFSALGLYCQFEKHEDHYIMFFQDDIDIINYATDELTPGEELEFKVTKDKIIKIKK